ncbi:MAG: GNAT family N-acetyltransferase [Clostridium sp.]|uniref:GNAT family N-acetyltransferase n=1 Tax=Clostridium sp. TaxID=1506 RepID=UPI003F2D55AE
MIFRKAVLKDFNSIRKIIDDAKEYLKESGVFQWQGEYPTDELLIKDINSGDNYVVEEFGEVIGTGVISFKGEETYEKIEGKWLSNDDFVVIHRLAVSKNFKNKSIASKMLKFTEELAKENGVYSIKIDTHKDNNTMKRLMEKNNFTYCGMIRLLDSTERIAFEKLLK